MIAADTPTANGIQRGRGGFMRNAAGVPYVSDPSGATVKSGARKGEPKRVMYSSTSNFGILIENQGSLEKWSERKVVEGIGIDPDLWRACAELAAMPADAEGRAAVADGIVVAAKRAANAWLAADRGTHAHSLTEHADRAEDWSHLVEGGVVLGIDPEQQAAIVDAWRSMLARHDIEVLAIEAAVVDDGWRCAGTLDRVVRIGRPLRFARKTGEVVDVPAGSVVVLDIKSGSTRKAHAVQIASYAQSVPYDTDAETRGEWPFAIDQQHALIAHIDIDGGTCDLVYVDLVAGREHGGECVVMAKAWEQRTDVFSVALLDGETSTGGDPASVAGGPIEGEPAATVNAAEAPDEPAGGESSAPPAVDQLAAVAKRTERSCDHVLCGDTCRAGIDEGAQVGRELAVLQREYGALDADGRAWITALTDQAMRAGVSFHLSSTKTVRRFEIVRALVLLAQQGLTDDQVVRDLLEPIIGDPAQFPSVPVGHLVGSLDASEAAKFAGLVDGRFAISFTTNGKPTLQPAA